MVKRIYILYASHVLKVGVAYVVKVMVLTL